MKKVLDDKHIAELAISLCGDQYLEPPLFAGISDQEPCGKHQMLPDTDFLGSKYVKVTI